MSGPPECAEALAGACGADVQDDSTPPVAPLFPAAPEMIFGLSAALNPAGRARLLALGIGPAAIDDPDARSIFAALLADERVDVPGSRVHRALTRERAGETSYGDAMLALAVCREDDGDDVESRRRVARHAERAIDRLAVYLAGRWLPAILRWCANRLEGGEPLGHVALDLDRWLTIARPSVLAAEGGGHDN
ncbi:MAG: hypothetical protein KIS87_05580 [Phycisphaeraceae bacterium]|nr:hypothetical protein [Phycisphaeraceae bacterium]